MGANIRFDKFLTSGRSPTNIFRVPDAAEQNDTTRDQPHRMCEANTMLRALITTLNTSVAVHRLVDEPLRINPRRSGAQEAASRAITEEANGVDCKTLR